MYHVMVFGDSRSIASDTLTDLIIRNLLFLSVFVESKMLYAKELQNLLNGLLAIDSRYGSNGRIFITLVKVLDNVIGGLNENCINRQ